MTERGGGVPQQVSQQGGGGYPQPVLEWGEVGTTRFNIVNNAPDPNFEAHFFFFFLR